MNALVMACWRQKPTGEVIVHSDQGCQYTSYDWRSMLKGNGLVASMSRKGNCHDNAVAESFFQLLKRERIRKKIYASREAPGNLITSSCFTIRFSGMGTIKTRRRSNLKRTIL